MPRLKDLLAKNPSHLTAMFMLVSLSLISNHPARAGEISEFTLFRRFLQNTNRVLPLETAGSKSPYRINAGAGLRLPPLPDQRGLIYEQYQVPDKQHKPITIPQIWLNTGLYYPFGIGVTFSTLWQQLQVSQAAAYLQWTHYEDFALPAFATRLTYGRTFGLKNVEIKSVGLQGIGSWGFRFLSLYAGLSLDYHQLSFSKGFAYVISRKASFELSGFYGLHLQLMPSLLYMVIDIQRDAHRQKTYSAKVVMEI